MKFVHLKILITRIIMFRKEVIGIIFLDLIAGIGGFRLEMEMAGHECMVT